MHEPDWLAERFEENRSYLRSIAYRMLGSLGDTDDALQEAWLKLSNSGVSGVLNLRAWLTTIVARVCLDMLRSRKSRREDPEGPDMLEPISSREKAADPEQEALLAESVGLALLVVLERLGPAERLAFVLHDMFAIPFDEIASLMGRSSAAARQLASRARRRVRGAPTVSNGELSHQREVVGAFLAALRAGDFPSILSVLDPDVVFRIESADGIREIRGARNFAESALAFSQNARFMALALAKGTVGIIMAPNGRLLRVALLAVRNNKIVEADVIVQPARLRELDLAILSG